VSDGLEGRMISKPERQATAAWRLALVATASTKALARIARAMERFESGRIGQVELLRTIHHEVRKVDSKTGQARRPSHPVRG
jgi:hypothetical protein